METGHSNDRNTTTVTVAGTRDDGTAETRTLTNRAGGVWTEADMPPGRYTASAVVTDPDPLSGSAEAAVSSRGAIMAQYSCPASQGA